MELDQIIRHIEEDKETGLDQFKKRFKYLVREEKGEDVLTSGEKKGVNSEEKKGVNSEEKKGVNSEEKKGVNSGGDTLSGLAYSTVEIGRLFYKREYQRLVETVDTHLKWVFTTEKRALDYFSSLIFKFYYYSNANSPPGALGTVEMMKYLIINKERGNEEMVSVLTNCILDRFISSKVYRRLDCPPNMNNIEQASFYYFNGVICLVEGEYKEALEYFHHSGILTESRRLGIKVEKLIILTMLLMSDFNIPYTYKNKTRAYFELIRVVKMADMSEYEKVVREYEEEYNKDGVYFIVQRLAQNVVQEGIRKISLVYSRISYEDIGKMINKEDVDYIVRKTIEMGLVQGRVSDGVFYSVREDVSFGDIDMNMRDSVRLSKVISQQMEYPKIEPLCYEKILEENE